MRPYSAGSPGQSTGGSPLGQGEPYVNLRHPERSTDLILLVDTFSAALLPRQVRAASVFAAAYLGAARPGRPRCLRRHLALGRTGHGASPARSSARCPHRDTMAPFLRLEERGNHSLAGTPLLGTSRRDQSARGPPDGERPRGHPARGVDLAIIETIGPGPVRPKSTAGDLAARLIDLERVGLRESFARRGVPVVGWHKDESLEAPLQALATWRRRARGRVAR